MAKGRMTADGFDPLRILAGLRAHGVSYVLVGGLAEAAHGSSSDADEVAICVLSDEDNLERLRLALDDLDARPVLDGARDEHRVSFTSFAGRLDCYEDPEGFSDLHERAIDMDLGRGIVARVASVEDIARRRRASGDLAGATRLALGSETRGQPGANARTPIDGGPPEESRAERIWRRLENVETFLVDLSDGTFLRRRKS